MSLIGAIGKRVISTTARNAAKLAHITDPAQRHLAQNVSEGGHNLLQLLREYAPDHAFAPCLANYLRSIDRYGISPGDIKYLIKEEPEFAKICEHLADKKFVDSVMTRKDLIKNGFLGCINGDNRKAFTVLLKDKRITDEQIEIVSNLLNNENLPIVKRLLSDKNFDYRILRDLPATHLKKDNVEVLKEIAKRGNVRHQEMLYIMTSTNGSNSDVALRLLDRAGENTNGLSHILSSVYAYEGMSEDALKAFELRKKFITEILDNPNFKLGKTDLENYNLSKVLSHVTPETYSMAKSAIFNGNVNWHSLAEFMKGVTSANREVAERIVAFASEGTRLPNLSNLNLEMASQYLDEVAKINNPEAQSLYVEAMDFLDGRTDEILEIIRTTKPENAKHASAVITSMNHTSASVNEIEEIVSIIEQSGRKLNNSEISNLVVLSGADEVPLKQFITRILNNKSIPDESLEHFTYQYLRNVEKINSASCDYELFYEKFSKGLISEEEFNQICSRINTEKKLLTIEKLPEILENLSKNKSLTTSDVEHIFEKITVDNIEMIEKNALSPEIRKITIDSPQFWGITKSQQSTSQVNHILKAEPKTDSEAIEKLSKDLLLRTQRFFKDHQLVNIVGEEHYAKLITGLENVQTKYGIKPEGYLSLRTTENGSNDLFIILEGKDCYGVPLSYKFNKKTGELVSINRGREAIDILRGSSVYDSVASECKIDSSKVELPPFASEDSFSIPYRINSTVKTPKGEFEIVYTESVVKGQYDIYRTTPDGKRIRIGHALVTPNGAKHIRRTLTSADGTKTSTAFREDKAGNSYLHTVIKDKSGKPISEIKRTFKVLSENHFVSTRNGQAFDIVFTDSQVVVTKLDSAGRKTAQKVKYAIRDIPIETTDEIGQALSHIQNDTESFEQASALFKKHGIAPRTVDRRCVEMLKRLPGDEWFAMSKSCEFVMPQSFEPMNASYAGNSIFMSKELIGNLGVFTHELGHAKFHILDLVNDKKLMEIYNAEKMAYTAKYPESRVESIAYFLEGNNDGKRGLNEACAETNLVTDTIQTWEQLQDRTIFLEQDFPRTMAYIKEKMASLI